MAQARSSGDDVTINVDGLAAELENLMSEKLLMSRECCIFKVPTILARHNQKAYAPNAFSIGPFHYKKQPLMEATQRIKLKYLRGIISRSDQALRPQTRLRNLIKEVTKVQEAALECYAGNIGMPADEFVRLLVLDGCFIVELFRKKEYENLREKDDPVFEMSCLLQFLYHDLVMLENQIPWVVLDTLFNSTSVTEEKPLVQLAIKFFGHIFSTTSIVGHQQLLSRPSESKHILDMLRNSLIWSSSIEKEAKLLNWQRMPSVTSLKEAGIKFEKGKTDAILDIEFQNGVLKIPSLLIQETTEPIFRNLISLEQCCPSYQPVITSYAILMSNLINTSSDVEILSKSKVLEKWLNVEDATKFFNELYTDTYVNGYYYFPLTEKVNKHCQHRWPKYRTVLMHDYFKHPWAFISVGVATLLVICALLQTLFTIIK